MAITEETALLHGWDQNGDHHILYPVTKIDSVAELPEELDRIRGQLAGSGAERCYGVTIGTSWAADETLYRQDIAVEGVLETDKPVVSQLLSMNKNTALDEMSEWEKIHSIKTQNGSITVYAFDPTGMELHIQMKC